MDFTPIYQLYGRSIMDLLDILTGDVIPFTCAQSIWPRQRLIINLQPKITS